MPTDLQRRRLNSIYGHPRSEHLRKERDAERGGPDSSPEAVQRIRHRRERDAMVDRHRREHADLSETHRQKRARQPTIANGGAPSATWLKNEADERRKLEAKHSGELRKLVEKQTAEDAGLIKGAH